MPLKTAALVFLATALIALSACSSQNTTTAAASAPAAPVKTAQAESRTVPVEIGAVGHVEASSTIVVKAQIGGTLVKAHFNEGDTVRQGQPLFEIDPRPYEEAVRQWEANLARDKALLAQAEANLARAQAQEAHFSKQADRYEKLAAEGIFSREQADQAAVEARARRTAVRAESAAIDSAKAAIRADESSLANAKLNLGYCTIRSPLAGRTGAILIKEGNLVKANDVEMVTIHQIQPAQVRFSIPEIHLAEIRQRMKTLVVRAVIPGDTRPPAEGAVDFIDNAVDMTTGMIRLKGSFTNADTRLWPGQYIDVRLRLSERANTVVVPAAAIQSGQNGNYAFVVKSDGTVEMRPVKPGKRLDNFIAVDQGLQAGETVVTEGHLRLMPGMKVRAVS